MYPQVGYTGLKPFCTELLFKNGEKRTSDCLDIPVGSNNYIVGVAGPDLAYFFAMKTNVVKKATK